MINISLEALVNIVSSEVSRICGLGLYSLRRTSLKVMVISLNICGVALIISVAFSAT